MNTAANAKAFDIKSHFSYNAMVFQMNAHLIDIMLFAVVVEW